jgi:hypothetical protein
MSCFEPLQLNPTGEDQQACTAQSLGAPAFFFFVQPRSFQFLPAPKPRTARHDKVHHAWVLAMQLLAKEAI